MREKILIDLNGLHGGNAKLDLIESYCQQAVDMAGEGKEVILTGAAPVWMYLAIAHSLHGKVAILYYKSPVTGDVVIFNHSC